MTEYSPFKCPDCGLWWRTATHKCETSSYVARPQVTGVGKPKLPSYGPRCTVCSVLLHKWELDTCWEHKKYNKNHNYKNYEKYKKENPNGPEEFPPLRWDS